MKPGVRAARSELLAYLSYLKSEPEEIVYRALITTRMISFVLSGYQGAEKGNALPATGPVEQAAIWLNVWEGWNELLTAELTDRKMAAWYFDNLYFD